MIEVVHIVARVTTDMTRFNAGMASMEARAKTATAKMSLAGMRMTKYLTLPIAGIAYAGIKTATSFQKSMTLIQTQAGASARDIPKITAAINQMSGRSVMQGPKDLADAYYHLQSVFGDTINVAQKLKILKATAQLAQIGGSTTEDTASAVAGIMRTRIKGARDVLQVVKTINGIVGSGNMRMPQFVESTGTAVLQTAKLAGLSLKEVGAAEAVFTDENMNANMSMTRFRTSLMMMAHPSKAAAGAMAELGFSAKQLGVTTRSRGFGAALDLISKKYNDFVTKMTAKEGKKAALSDAFALMAGSFGGSRSASTIMTLVNQNQMFGQKMAQITNKSLRYNKDLQASNKTLSVQFEKAWARMQVALQKFGLAIAPVVLGALHALVRLANAFTSLPTPIQHFIAAVGVGLAVLGPMLIMISSVIKIFGDLGAMLGVGGEVSLGLGSILPLAIIAAVGALVYFMMKSKTFRAWVKSWATQVAGFFKWLGEDVIGPFFYKVYKWFSEGGKASRWNTIVIPALKAAGHAFKTIGTTIWKILNKIAGAIEEVIKRGQQLARWSYGIGGAVAGFLGAGEGKGLNAKQKLLTAMDAAHSNKKLYNQLRREAIQKGYINPPKPPRKPIAHHHHHHHNADRHLQSHHSGHDRAPLVHVAEMHVRNESDAEIVSGKIARKVMIP